MSASMKAMVSDRVGAPLLCVGLIGCRALAMARCAAPRLLRGGQASQPSADD
jgi:hypothetical protein